MRLATFGGCDTHSKLEHFVSSTLISIDGVHYLIDASLGINAILERQDIDLTRIRGIFITHMHENHASGLPSLIKAIIQRHDEKGHTVIHLPENGAAEALGGWLCANHIEWPSPRFSVRLTLPGVFYTDELVSVEAIPTYHLAARNGGIGSYAYMIEADEQRVIATGDLSKDLSEFGTRGKLGDMIRSHKPQVVVFEAQHFEVALALPVIRDLPIEHLIVNQVDERWEGNVEAELASSLESLPFRATVAHDGTSMELERRAS